MRLILAMSRLVPLVLIGMAVLLPAMGQPPAKPYRVTIIAEKDQFVERFLPLDPTIRINYNYNGSMGFGGLQLDDQRISNSISTLFMIDGAVRTPGGANQLQPLPVGPSKKKRYGGQTVWEERGISVTMSLEAVPGKLPQSKPGQPVARRMDTLLIKYTIENRSNVARKVGCQMGMDTYVINNDQCLFASPTTHPNQVLNGIVLKNKEVPAFIEVLQQPDPQNPGFKAIFTLKFSDKLEGPSKVVLTRHALQRQWDPPAEAAGDSACALIWEPREIQPQSKREIAYAFGQGFAVTNEGRVEAVFSGSFEPGRLFTVMAYVEGPIDGQSLMLQLPQGIERVEGQATQIVPLADESGQSVVMWRCRMRQTGTYPVSIRSNNGVTQTWQLSILPPG